MSNVFHRYPRADLPRAVEGDGIYIIDAEGKRYLDASGGAAVSCLGHSHPAVRQAIKDQIDSLAYSHSSFFTNRPMEDLAELLIEQAPEGIERVYFVSGGSEAVEAALKLARQYFVETGQPQRRHFIARRQSYHGNTLGGLAVGGNMWRRQQFEPMLIEAHHISPCYAYRDQRAQESETEYGLRVADELEAKIRELGPETVIGFVAEPVVGATAGALAAVPGYFKRIREICDRHGVLLILDEVMCGMGRTGAPFACDQEGVRPDLLVAAKGLGGGYQPVGALFVSGAIYDAIVQGSGFFQHGHTYMGHATACAAALAVQQTIRDEGLLANVQRMGAALMAGLEARLGNHRHVGDIRGRGLFVGIELVADRATKAPFEPSARLSAGIKAEAMARRLMCYPMAGCIDGKHGDHVLLAPPFIVTGDEIDIIVARTGDAIDAAVAASS